MNQTDNNHYSPTFTNRPWANQHGSITRLWRRTQDGQLVSDPTGPKDWGREKHLYPQRVENALSTFETKVAPLYRKLLRGEKLDPMERLLWSRWILCQFSRTPTYALELANIGEDIVSAFPEFSDDFASVDFGTVIDSALSDNLSYHDMERLIPFIVLRDWIVMRPAAGEFFIKGDVPVIIRRVLVNDKATIVYPLSPDYRFVATVLGGFPPHQLQAEGHLKPGGTKFYLRLVAACAEREVICHPDHFTPSSNTWLQTCSALHHRSWGLFQSRIGSQYVPR